MSITNFISLIITGIKKVPRKQSLPPSKAVAVAYIETPM